MKVLERRFIKTSTISQSYHLMKKMIYNKLINNASYKTMELIALNNEEILHVH